VTLFLGKTVLFNFVFSRRYVAKMTGKSVFSDKITGKKGGLFCRRLFFRKTVFPKKNHSAAPSSQTHNLGGGIFRAGNVVLNATNWCNMQDILLTTNVFINSATLQNSGRNNQQTPNVTPIDHNTVHKQYIWR